MLIKKGRDSNLFPLSQMMVETEQVAGKITDNYYLVDDLAGMFFFFFHLLLDKPLEHLKCCVIFLLDGKVNKSRCLYVDVPELI